MPKDKKGKRIESNAVGNETRITPFDYICDFYLNVTELFVRERVELKICFNKILIIVDYLKEIALKF